MDTFKVKASIASGFFQARLFKKRLPLLVGWAVTGRCNRDCFYCNTKTCGKELNTQEAVALLDRLAVAGTQLVQFTGGEPLLREDIGRLVQHAKNKGLMVNLSSNGTFVPDRIDEIKAVDVLNLSLEGPPEVHDRMRGQSAHADVMRALDAAIKHKLNVRLCSTLTAINLDATDYLLETAKKYAVKIFFQPAISMTPSAVSEPFTAEPEMFRKKINHLIYMKQNGVDLIGNSLSGLRYFLNWPDKKDVFCGAGLVFCRIEPDGTLYPCSRTIEPVYAVRYRERFLDSFSQLQNVRCQACWANSLLEANLLLSLDVAAMIESLKGAALTDYKKK
jgi:MoaA/NifB/PqqE/SkfB family radical SAM enzyme